MKVLSSTISMLLALLVCQANYAQAANENQDSTSIRAAAEQFLKQQASGQPGAAKVSVGEIDKRLNLNACNDLVPFLPQGSKPWGKIIVGVRCTTPTPWVVYLTATVKVMGEYYVSAGPILQGQVIAASDLAKVSGELSNLPVGAITNPALAIGRTMSVSISSGSVLRADALKNTPVVQQGQMVKIMSKGKGFQVATDGQSLSNASEGQIARAKTSSGQVVSGIAKIGGVIEVVF